MARGERVAENLNRALQLLLATDPCVYVLGEDVVDPYGGAFKVTKGLSSRHPGRVLGTPISENGILGVAGGLALAGQKPIVEIMFSDFMALAFDQIVNFASKSVSMYGRSVPMRLLVRCATGGNRGYGPTHSQSLQKHFIGVPNLDIFEASPFHDNRAVMAEILSSGRPSILFEDKVLYTNRMYTDGIVDDLFNFILLGDSPHVAKIYMDDPSTSDCAIIAPGGLTLRALSAARKLLLQDEINCQVLVPSRLYPFNVEAILPALANSGRVCIVEDSTAGGTWGAGIAHEIHTRLWGRLRVPIRLLHAPDGVIPSAAHLERAALVQDIDIYTAVREMMRRD